MAPQDLSWMTSSRPSKRCAILVVRRAYLVIYRQLSGTGAGALSRRPATGVAS
jgi:hypothetical protein